MGLLVIQVTSYLAVSCLPSSLSETVLSGSSRFILCSRWSLHFCEEGVWWLGLPGVGMHWAASKPPLPEDEDRPRSLYLHSLCEGTKETLCTWECWCLPERVTPTLKCMHCRDSSRKLRAALYCHPGTVGKPDERTGSVSLPLTFLSAVMQDNLETAKPVFPLLLLPLYYLYSSVSLLLSWGFMYLWGFPLPRLSLSSIHNWIGLLFR